jgi:hypothetical protein
MLPIPYISHPTQAAWLGKKWYKEAKNVAAHNTNTKNIIGVFQAFIFWFLA